jgi:hypothetical protein
MSLFKNENCSAVKKKSGEGERIKSTLKKRGEYKKEKVVHAYASNRFVDNIKHQRLNIIGNPQTF